MLTEERLKQIREMHVMELDYGDDLVIELLDEIDRLRAFKAEILEDIKFHSEMDCECSMCITLRRWYPYK